MKRTKCEINAQWILRAGRVPVLNIGPIMCPPSRPLPIFAPSTAPNPLHLYPHPPPAPPSPPTPPRFSPEKYSSPVNSLYSPSPPPPPRRRRAYQAFDINGDGHIDADELKSVLDNLGERVSADALTKMIEEVDTDGNKTVEWDEFCQMMHNIR